ncbi:hypothetical protein NLU13_0770 [Sarocladium strictum]|uniref:Altered inheritance of mitochondria protein 41 n=1 Tax=Sarocladium strictum TaxID=5046 RepID=A0AA39GRL5_SARSR|nr:hypothetical protein NLU13_0770 [Sarocladium strictum]
MAALRCLRWLRPVANPPRAIPTFSTASLRFYSAEASPKTPKSLPLIKNDLKSAMRAKDAPRLAVLRNILSANLNASKTSSPVQTDVQLVALLRKLRKPYEDAAAEAEAAGRSDLVEKERQQLDILDGYIQACGVETVAKSELEAMVQKAVDAAKAAQAGPKEVMGKVMGAVMGQLEGKDRKHASQSKHLTQSLQRINVNTGSAFEAKIGYSRAVVTGDWVLVSGTTGYDYKTGEISPDVAEQTQQTLENIAAALEQAGSSIKEVVRVHYILPDRDDFPKTWEVLKKWFGDVGPAATMVQSGLMKDEMKIEIEVTARKGAVVA